jgi:hypothetical protein
MSKIIDLTHEKLNRTWETLNGTWAKVERTGAALDDKIRKSQISRVRRKLWRRAREAREATPAPRLTVVKPD